MREYHFTAGDGTRLAGFDNEGSGPPVVLVPGLATPPQGMPSLLVRDNGFHVVGFNMRGTHGSDKPADLSRITVPDHAADAVALMDHVGFDKAVFAGWSLGVNIAFETAISYPERVEGVLAVGGVPGDTFDAFFAPFGVPEQLSRPLVRTLYSIGRKVGSVLEPVIAPVPVGPEVGKAMAMVGATAGGDPEQVAKFFELHGKQDLGWVSELARAANKHERLEIYNLTIPMAFIAGTRDYMTSAAAVIAAAGDVPHASLDVVKGTHTLGLEHPELVLQRLRDVARGAGYED